MIARLWHGMTDAAQADAYLAFLNRVAVDDYQAPGGNLGVTIMRRIEGDRAHFLLLSLWEDQQALVRYAGSNFEKAKYYPEDRQFLLELEPTVTHYEVMTAVPGIRPEG